MGDDLSRRDLMAGSGAAVLLGSSTAASSQTPGASAGRSPDVASATAGSTATGSVHEVVLDPAAPAASPLRQGPPIAGVLVSNGRDVVRTDAEGRYSLAVAPGQTIFLIKPAGFQVPIAAATRLPLFGYVHDPEGTPPALGFRYRGMQPTGPLPVSIDFLLTRAAEPSRYDVILFTDPQPESSVEVAYVRDAVIAGLVGSEAAFGITCGDIAFDDLSMYGRINRIVGRIGLPWWNVGGNHDLDYEAPDAERSRDTFKRVYGASYYAHEHGHALFIMLDNVDYAGTAPEKPGGRGAYRGVISADQLAFVGNLLALTPVDRLLVFCMHIPLRTYLGPTDPGQNTVNLPALLALIGERPAVSFAGHTHSTEHHYFGAADGGSDAHPHHHHVLTAVSGSWWSGPKDHRGIACADSYDGSPNGYHVLSIDGADYTTRFVPASEPRARQMRISLDAQFHGGDRDALRELDEVELLGSPITGEQAAATRVVVNMFDGGPRSELLMLIDGGAPIPMVRVAKPDPFVVQLYLRYRDTIKPWVSPKPCSHLWQATLPPGLTSGAHTLQVVARDEYGRTLKDAMVLEIA